MADLTAAAAAIIGREAVARLLLAGFDIMRRPPPEKMVSRYTCPHCGYSARGGEVRNVSAEWGKWWHTTCVPYPPSYYDTRWKPMTETREPR